jgi:hypothetical protein
MLSILLEIPLTRLKKGQRRAYDLRYSPLFQQQHVLFSFHNFPPKNENNSLCDFSQNKKKIKSANNLLILAGDITKVSS